jgi:GGDEF domain-containing protein
LQNLSQPLTVEGRIVRVGASIGVALYPDDATEMEALCIAADLRMYDEKNFTRGTKEEIAAGKILPQTVADEPAQPGFGIASERFSA